MEKIATPCGLESSTLKKKYGLRMTVTIVNDSAYDRLHDQALEKISNCNRLFSIYLSIDLSTLPKFTKYNP